MNFLEFSDVNDAETADARAAISTGVTIQLHTVELIGFPTTATLQRQVILKQSVRPNSPYWFCLVVLSSTPVSDVQSHE